MCDEREVYNLAEGSTGYSIVIRTLTLGTGNGEGNNNDEAMGNARKAPNDTDTREEDRPSAHDVNRIVAADVVARSINWVSK